MARGKRPDDLEGVEGPARRWRGPAPSGISYDDHGAAAAHHADQRDPDQTDLATPDPNPPDLATPPPHPGWSRRQIVGVVTALALALGVGWLGGDTYRAVRDHNQAAGHAAAALTTDAFGGVQIAAAAGGAAFAHLAVRLTNLGAPASYAGLRSRDPAVEIARVEASSEDPAPTGGGLSLLVDVKVSCTASYAGAGVAALTSTPVTLTLRTADGRLHDVPTDLPGIDAATVAVRGCQPTTTSKPPFDVSAAQVGTTQEQD